jgi:hypothetical protein
MANHSKAPVAHTDVRRTLVSSQMQAANIKSAWREPDYGEIIKGAGQVLETYYKAEKDAAFKRLDIEASKMQLEELEAIRVAENNEQIPEIESNFKSNLNTTFANDPWGKQWLAERGDVFLAANSRDVMRANISKQHELYALEMNKTIGTWANDIATSAPDKAKVLMGDMDQYISNAPLLSPEEKQKAKDNGLKLVLQKMATSNPEMAKQFLASGEFDGNINIDSKAEIDNIIKKQIAEIDFNRKVKFFNNEMKMSEELDDMTTDQALRFLEENEHNVSDKYFKAKQKSILAAKGITSETRAETATEIMLDIAALDKDNEVSYLQGAQDVLTKIEEKYSSGELSLKDRRSLIGSINKEQGKQLDYLKTNEDDDEWWRFGDFTFKDANTFIEENSSTVGNNGKILLDYFRKTQGKDIKNAEKRNILKSLVDKANAGELSKPTFESMEGVTAAFNSGKIKKGDVVYVNGKRATVK